MLIWNVPLEYQIEEDLLTKDMGEERYLPYLVSAAQTLEQGGAHFIVIPCNTVHIFIKEVRESVKIPVLSIVEETTNFLASQGLLKLVCWPLQPQLIKNSMINP